tara:strand:+ start:308 stop:559 length:252 start_codon:yes stop_codon:yes gene_type:complete
MACCNICDNFDEQEIDNICESDAHEKELLESKDYQPDLYYYWHGDIEEDYDMGYDCLCEICFDIQNSEGKIKWKDDKNPFDNV